MCPDHLVSLHLWGSVAEALAPGLGPLLPQMHLWPKSCTHCWFCGSGCVSDSIVLMLK